MTLMNNDDSNSWKRNNYVKGTAIGLVIGMIAAYLYNRTVEEDAVRNGGQPSPIQTAQLIGLSLSALGLLRQIADLGKPSKK